jgi:hypothetical protein
MKQDHIVFRDSPLTIEDHLEQRGMSQAQLSALLAAVLVRGMQIEPGGRFEDLVDLLRMQWELLARDKPPTH